MTTVYQANWFNNSEVEDLSKDELIEEFVSVTNQLYLTLGGAKENTFNLYKKEMESLYEGDEEGMPEGTIPESLDWKETAPNCFEAHHNDYVFQIWGSTPLDFDPEPETLHVVVVRTRSGNGKVYNNVFGPFRIESEAHYFSDDVRDVNNVLEVDVQPILEPCLADGEPNFDGEE